MQSRFVHDFIVQPLSNPSRLSPTDALPSENQGQAPVRFSGGIAAATTEYELRLLDADGRQIKTVRFRRLDDDSARRFILTVGEDFDRYELWRGMQKIGHGGRLIIR